MELSYEVLLVNHTHSSSVHLYSVLKCQFNGEKFFYTTQIHHVFKSAYDMTITVVFAPYIITLTFKCQRYLQNGTSYSITFRQEYSDKNPLFNPFMSYLLI